MRILLTGGAGFIGSHLCDFLIKQGHGVICMDSLVTGKKENIQHLLDNPEFEFIKHDVSNFIDVKGEIDYVLHFASPASPIDYLKYPIKTLKVGSLGTHNALGVAKEHKAKFLLASTSEIYGDPLVNPQPESYWGNVNCIGPRGVYDEAKRFAEAITLAYHRSHGIDTKIARIFNTYGPSMRSHDGRAIPNFIDQALKGEPLTVYGDGSQTRSFCIHPHECIAIINSNTGVFEVRRIEGVYKELSHQSYNLNGIDIIKLEAYSTYALNLETKQIVIEPMLYLTRRKSAEEMLEMRLRYGGQIFRVTSEHSLLVWQNGFFVEKKAKDVVVGDNLPSAVSIPKPAKTLSRLNLLKEFIENVPSEEISNVFVKKTEECIEFAKNKLGNSYHKIHSMSEFRTHYDHVVNRKTIWIDDFVKLMVKADFHKDILGKLYLGVKGGRHDLPVDFEISPRFMRLLGYFVAEGNYNTSRELAIVFTNNDKRILDDIKESLDELGISCTESICSSGTPQITVGSRLLYLLFRDVFKIGIKRKCLPRYIYNLPYPLISEFLKGYFSGDGWISNIPQKSSFRIGLTSVSSQLLKEINILLTMLGIPCTLKKTQLHIGGYDIINRFSQLITFVQDEKNRMIYDYLQNVKHKGGGNRLFKNKRGDISLNRVVKIRKIPSAEYVYDLQVPNNNFMLCDNSTVFVHNCYITDLIDGIYKLMNSGLNEPVNLGNPNEMTVLDLAENIIRLTGSKSKIEHEPLPVNDPKVRRPDITKAKAELIWQPKVGLEEGLKKTIEWFRQ